MNDKAVHFSWQNPHLRATIYPFRLQMLRDFLAAYHEIALWQKYSQADRGDPEIASQISRSHAKISAAFHRLENDLSQTLTVFLQEDRLFAGIKGHTPATLLFKRKYYLPGFHVTIIILTYASKQVIMLGGTCLSFVLFSPFSIIF